MKRISNSREYEAIKKRIDELLEVVCDENYNLIPEAIELEFLSGLIEDYEQQHFPISMTSSKMKEYESEVVQ
jgi:HTH-type transcriptional regulator/antitoxin HigA